MVYYGNYNTSGITPMRQAKHYGINLVLRFNTGNLVRTGYSFGGWNTASNGSGANYAEGVLYDGGNLSLYAKWLLNSYTINYNLNGGVNHESNPGNYTVEDVIELRKPSKLGYVFKGWYENETFEGSSITEIPLGNTGNKELWANWKLAFAEGDGSKETPFEISTIEQLRNFSILVNTCNQLHGNKRYMLVNNIEFNNILNWEDWGIDGFNASELNQWTPIGLYIENDAVNSISFTGNFNGNGHTINGLYANKPDANSIGFFGFLGNGGIIENFGVINSNITGSMNVGGMAGVNNGEIHNSFFKGVVTGNGINSGGLVGDNNGKIIASFTHASVSGTSHVGGFVGRQHNENSVIENCYSIGSVTGDKRTGGFIGRIWAGTIENSFTTTTVEGRLNIGGFAGLVNRNAGAILKNSYSAATITLEDNAEGFGGFIGAFDNSGPITIEACFWDVDAAGQNESAAGEGKRTVEMHTSNTFTHWDFDNAWVMGSIIDGCLYPKLQSQGLNTPALEPQKDGDIYLISSVDDLRWIAENPDSWDKEFRQTADINFPDNLKSWDEGRGWKTIGKPIAWNIMTPFVGTYNGENFSITGLYINRPDTDYQGLFSITGNANIKDISLVDVEITGRNNVGGIVGGALGSTIIDNCSVYGVVIGINYAGGVVGYNKGTIQNCYNTGNVSGNGQSVGGVVGSNDGTIQNCFNTGNVSGDFHVGGVGGFNNDAAIQNCYNTGNVSGNSYVGGIVGRNNGTMQNCFNTGNVSGDLYVGEVGGYNQSTIQNSYYLSTTDAGEQQKTSEQFASGKVARLLQGSQVEHIWGHTILDGTEFPRLFFENGTVKQVFEVAFNVEDELHAINLTLNGTSVAFPDEPIAAGFSFVGWSKAGGELFTQQDDVTSDLLLTALFDVAISLPEAKALSQVKVRPNPFTNQITLSNAQSITRVVILNSTGMVVADELLHKEHTHTITCNLPSGIYMLMLYDKGGNHEVKKIVREK